MQSRSTIDGSGVQDHRIRPVEIASVPAVVRQRQAIGRTWGLILRRRWRAVGGMILASLLVGAAICRMSTPLYTASAQVMLQEAGTRSASAADRQAFLQTQRQVLTSTSVLAMAISSPGVRDISLFRGDVDPLKSARRLVRVDANSNGDLLTVAVDSPDAREGTTLVAAVVDSFVRFESGLRGSIAKGSASTLLLEKTHAIADQKQKWAALQSFAAEHGVARGDEQIDSADTALHEIGIRLANAHVDTAAARAGYDEMLHDLQSEPAIAARLAKLPDDDDAVTAGDEQSIGREIAALKSQLSNYAGHFMANYPAVQAATRRIDDLKVARDAIIRHRYQSAQRCEDSLRSSFNQQQATAAGAETNQKTYRQLRIDAADAEKQVGILDARLRALDPADESVKTIVTVTDPAAASDSPTSPRVGWILCICGVVGLLAGAGVAGWIDRRALPQFNPGVASKIAGLSVLARLPAVQRRFLAIGQADRAIDTASTLVDACGRICRTLDELPPTTAGRTVLITSTDPREGKSTLTSLLAATLARGGRRVLLVDANMTTPVQGRLFGVQHESGLAELLESDVELDFTAAVQAGRDGLVDVMLPGSTTLRFEDLLNSERFTHVMSEMAHHYEFVLIDSAAVSVNAEARIIAGSCDATILLAGESKLQRKLLNRTRQALSMVGGNVIGLVLNAGTEAIAPRTATEEFERDVVTVDVSRRVRPEVVSEASTMSSGMSSAADQFADVFHAARHVEMNVDAAARFDGSADEAVDAFARSRQRGGVSVAEFAVAATAMIVAVAALHRGGGATALPLTGTRGIALSMTNTLDVTLWFAALAVVWTIATGRAAQVPNTTRRRFGEAALTLFAHVSATAALMILGTGHVGGARLFEAAGIASCVASILTVAIAPARTSLCFWISPLAVAVIGYAANAVAIRVPHGELLHNALGALARPVPMVYASMGPIGALVGVWIGRQFSRLTVAFPSSATPSASA